MKNKLIMVDMDGTLIHTIECNLASYEAAFKDFGFNFDSHYYINNCQGQSYKEFIPTMINSSDLNLVNSVNIKKQEYYSKYMHLAIVNNHLLQIIKSLKEVDYFSALVTNASKKNCLDIITYLNLSDLFDLIVTRDDVKNPKPNPECYLKTMSYFNLSPKDSLIIEDSIEGVMAAKASGAQVYQFQGF